MIYLCNETEREIIDQSKDLLKLKCYMSHVTVEYIFTDKICLMIETTEFIFHLYQEGGGQGNFFLLFAQFQVVS